MPDKNDEYFLYQTLIGTVPFEGVDAGFIERIKQYVIKAVREAKVHTNWITSDAEYEEAFLEFIDRVLKPVEDNSFLKEFLPYQERVADYGILNSLSQVLLKAAAPGLPDFYQGTELWDFSLVDPDNRRPVDYAFRARLLDQIRKAAKREVRPLVRELWEKRVDGRIKLFLVMRVLEARTKNRAVFDRGSYLPLSVEGERAEHLFAFARRSERSWAVAVVPRLCSKLVPPGTVPVGAETWKDTRILLPRAAPREWKDALIETACSATKDALFAADLFTDLPVALLSGEM
jgi:(1->4)-alpha-D-glucan 1-alpha-D-glucosylmutase